jgi:Rhs element Vgr protein
VNIVLLEVSNVVNRIASARIVLVDGDPAAETFAHSSGDVFVPGNELEIQLGYSDSVETVFKGIIVKQKIISRNNGGALELTCKHQAYKMATAEAFCVFEEVSDADVIQQKTEAYGLESNLATTGVTHENLVQYKCTDWDFIVNRAESNGHVVICEPDGIKTTSPEVSAEAALELQFGATMLEFEAELDGRNQEESLTALGWNYDNQEANETESILGDLASLGNLASSDLASALEISESTIRFTALNKQEELEALAGAEQKRKRLSKIRATVTAQGNTSCSPGSTISLHGLGDRFNGNALVTGVNHHFKNGIWKTTYQIGLNATSHLETFLPQPKSAFAIPRAQGLEIGVVTDLDDPTGNFRVRVQFPSLGEQQGVWARVAQPDAGDQRTVFFRPEVGDEVVVGFINDDPRAPIIIGSLHSSAKPSPLEQNSDNNEKGIVTRSDLRLVFDDEKKSITLSTPAGNSIVLSDDDQYILIEDQHGNKIEMSSSGISVESATALTMKAGTDLTIEATNLTLEASAQLKAEGSASAEVSSGGVTTVKGSLVQIN